MDWVLKYLKNIDWDGPQAFGVAAIVIFAVMRKWVPLIMVFITIGIASRIEDYFVLNFDLNGVAVTSSMMVYVIGAVAVLFVTFLSIFDK